MNWGRKEAIIQKRIAHLHKWLNKRGLRVCSPGARLIASERVKSWKAYANLHSRKEWWNPSTEFDAWWNRVSKRSNGGEYHNFQNFLGKGLTLRSPWPFKTYPPK